MKKRILSQSLPLLAIFSQSPHSVQPHVGSDRVAYFSGFLGTLASPGMTTISGTSTTVHQRPLSPSEDQVKRSIQVSTSAAAADLISVFCVWRENCPIGMPG